MKMYFYEEELVLFVRPTISSSLLPQEGKKRFFLYLRYRFWFILKCEERFMF